MKFEYLLFDADNTLLDFSASEHNAFINTMKKHGFPHDESIKKQYDEINHGLWKRYECGEISRDEVVNTRFGKLFETIGVTGDGVAFERLYQAALGDGHDTIKDAMTLLEKLKSMGKKIYIVTNGVAVTQYKRLEASGIDKMVDGIFISEEIGYQKPSIHFFDAVFAEIAPFEKEKTLIIGDTLTSDILGGNNAGIATCWYNPKELTNTTIATVDYEIKSLMEVLSLV